MGISKWFDCPPLQWFMTFGNKTKANYIPSSITLPKELSENQSEAAKKAIEWLVTKAPHTFDEIAEHFDITNELVSALVKILKSEERVYTVKVEGVTFVLKNKPVKSKILNKKTNRTNL